MTSRLRWIATLLAGFGIIGFVFLNYQDPWPPLVPRELTPAEPVVPPLPPGAFPLGERTRPEAPAPAEDAVDAEAAPPEAPALPTKPRSDSEPADAPASPPPDLDLEDMFAAATRLLESANLQPLHDDGALLGVRIGSVQAESFLARSGLRSGDVVRSVNDLRLDDPNAAAVLARQIARGIPLDVDVERDDGTPVRLSIPVRDLLAGLTAPVADEEAVPSPGSGAEP